MYRTHYRKLKYASPWGPESKKSLLLHSPAQCLWLYLHTGQQIYLYATYPSRMHARTNERTHILFYIIYPIAIIMSSSNISIKMIVHWPSEMNCFCFFSLPKNGIRSRCCRHCQQYLLLMVVLSPHYRYIFFVSLAIQLQTS